MGNRETVVLQIALEHRLAIFRPQLHSSTSNLPFGIEARTEQTDTYFSIEGMLCPDTNDMKFLGFHIPHERHCRQYHVGRWEARKR